MKNYIKYFILSLILISAGCETDVKNVSLPEFKQKLVVTSFLTPSDKVSYINISSNKRLFGDLTSFENPGKLTGFISDGVNEVALDTFNTGFKIKNERMQIQYGGTYKLKVKSEQGLSAEAECTIPEKRNLSMSADTFHVVRPTDHITAGMDFILRFTDFGGEENYYRISAKIAVYDNNNYPFKYWVNTVNGLFQNEYFTDKGKDGKIIDISPMHVLGNYYSADSVYLKLYLLSTDKSYYLYHKSLNDYQDGGNPFSEATPVYTNITGGLGIFASYTTDSLIIRLK